MPEPTWTRTALVTFVVAIAAGGAAIGLARGGTGGPLGTTGTTRPRATTTHATTTRAVTTTTAVTTTAPAPAAVEPNGAETWPAETDGWTLVLESYPQTDGTAAPARVARRAAAAGLPQVGVLRSSSFASLRAGYLVVFSGIYTSSSAAEAGLERAVVAGFPGAYTRQIAR